MPSQASFVGASGQLHFRPPQHLLLQPQPRTCINNQTFVPRGKDIRAYLLIINIIATSGRLTLILSSIDHQVQKVRRPLLPPTPLLVVFFSSTNIHTIVTITSTILLHSLIISILIPNALASLQRLLSAFNIPLIFLGLPALLLLSCTVFDFSRAICSISNSGQTAL